MEFLFLAFKVFHIKWDELPECIPVMKRPTMIISGDPHNRLKPISPPPIKTRTVLCTSVPFLEISKTHKAFKQLKGFGLEAVQCIKCNVCISRILYLPNLVTCIPTVREPTRPPMANIDTVTEYISVRVSSSTSDPFRLTMVWLKKSFMYY